MKTRIVATALIKKDNKFIFIRKKGENILHLPGGAIEDNESIPDALSREIKEECNITISNIQPKGFAIHDHIHDSVPSQTVYLQFTADYLDGELKGGDDAEEIITLSPEEIPKSNQNPLTIKFLKKLGVI